MIYTASEQRVEVFVRSGESISNPLMIAKKSFKCVTQKITRNCNNNADGDFEFVPSEMGEVRKIKPEKAVYGICKGWLKESLVLELAANPSKLSGKYEIAKQSPREINAAMIRKAEQSLHQSQSAVAQL